MSTRSSGHGSPRWAWLLGTLSAALNVSCGDSNPDVLRDTTGATFSWTCSLATCTVEPVDAPPPAQCNDSKVFYSYLWGNFFEVCSVVGMDDGRSWFTNGSLCRFVVCDSDDECPQLPNAKYACSAGLCQNVESKGEVHEAQVVALCMAEEPRPSDCQAQIDDPEVSAQFARARENCESPSGPCTVPAECRQP
ncbi:hypothetical protein [Polyangium sp. 15x6]|uniref:hypothetical protein n=1 Tax=Polyangium sp. 15x6 TaxID=3042687 RepID=UPI00249CC469|nr:hypothetical protein [Polyangium sp. 15x6]MDI3285765.1 hypothetical protein [Polyangium sp. 15x6]